MARYLIKNASGDVVNTIEANEAFVRDTFDYYELEVEDLSDTKESAAIIESRARSWRDLELSGSDWIVSLTDHPSRPKYMAYRTKLRDWPNKDKDGEYINGFPTTQPALED